MAAMAVRAMARSTHLQPPPRIRYRRILPSSSYPGGIRIVILSFQYPSRFRPQIYGTTTVPPLIAHLHNLIRPRSTALLPQNKSRHYRDDIPRRVLPRHDFTRSQLLPQMLRLRTNPCHSLISDILWIDTTRDNRRALFHHRLCNHR